MSGDRDEAARLRLRPLRKDDEEAVVAGQAAMAADDFVFALFHEPGTAWTDHLEDMIDRTTGRR